jgi:type VI secretion system protein ImpE
MLSAEDLYRQGKLEDAIEAATAKVRDHPDDHRTRTFLFELLCFAGEYTRAERQLDVLADSGKDALLGTLLYHGALNAERTRQEMFEKRTYPGGPHAPDAIHGSLNGKPFQSLRDADARIGARLEVYAAGDYLWIPLEHVSALELDPPKRLRDLLWTPARLKVGPSFQGKDLGEILIPVLSPLTSQHPDDAVRLGRVTEWATDERGEEAPYGPKIFLVDGEEVPLLEIRKLEIESAAAKAD